MAGEQVEHVVEKAHARARACPRRCRAASATAARRSRRSCARWWRCRVMASHSPACAPPSTRRAPRSPRARDRRAGGGELGRRAGPDPHLASCAGGSGAARASEAKRAAPAGRQDVVGAGDVVAEGGGALSADEQAAGATARSAASASTSAPISSRCSGANALASAIACVRVGDVDDRERGIADGRALDDELAEHRRERVAGARRRATRPPRQAALAVLGLGEHVQRRQLHLLLAGMPLRARRADRCGPAKPSMPTTARELALGLLHIQVARGRRSRRRGAPSRCRGRARRSPARRPCGRPARPRTAGRLPRIAGSISPSGPGGEQTATSITPAARAVTTPITTVLGYGARPPGT